MRILGYFRPDRFQVVHCIGDTGHSPPRDASSGSGVLCVGVEAKLESSDIESDVERLVEVRIDAECLRVPLLCAAEIRRGINRGAKAEEMAWPGHAKCLGCLEDKYCCLLYTSDAADERS